MSSKVNVLNAKRIFQMNWGSSLQQFRKFYSIVPWISIKNFKGKGTSQRPPGWPISRKNVPFFVYLIVGMRVARGRPKELLRSHSDVDDDSFCHFFGVYCNLILDNSDHRPSSLLQLSPRRRCESGMLRLLSSLNEFDVFLHRIFSRLFAAYFQVFHKFWL